ncbi:MAG: hypothetical protein QOF89_2088 [Acidobacteriota bacterium]|jgi:hypothetical protein|nr:hypothetical protein [Acidobacteriota bacterium]
MKRSCLVALGALAVTGTLAIRAQQSAPAAPAEPPRRRFIAPQLEMQVPSPQPEAAPATGAPWTYLPCPYAKSPVYPELPGVCHPYPQPWPKSSNQTTTGCPGACKTVVTTGQGIFPPSNPFNFETFPGTNFLPTIYTNAFDSSGAEIPNTLPSTPDVPYNLQEGDPVVSLINPTSPEDDLRTLFDQILRLTQGDDEKTGLDRLEQKYDDQAVKADLRLAIDILEGNPVPGRAYSGLPLLHYTGPEKEKVVVPIKDLKGNVIGGNVDVHQVWFDERIESDTAFINLSPLYDPSTQLPLDVPWTVTYTVDVLNRGRDDFSPLVMYIDPPTKKPGIGMDQTFFDMEDGTRTVFKIKMAPPGYLNLVYTWGWRMHPPRAQVMENAGKKISYCKTPPCDTPPACPADFQGKTLPELEQAVFCLPENPNCTQVRCRPGDEPAQCEKQKLYAIAQIGDLAPEKRMWHAVGEARTAADRGDFKAVAALVRDKALPAYFDWLNRNQLPAGVLKDPDSDVTLLYVNNSTYGELTNGAWGRWDAWEQRPKKLKVTVYNGDNFVHSYTIADFGGNRGWENQFKSSVKVAGSGCWFTFGRNYWWLPVGGPVNPFVCVPPTNGLAPGVHKLEIELNFDPSRRLRFYQFDPFHHDVAIYSIH